MRRVVSVGIRLRLGARRSLASPTAWTLLPCLYALDIVNEVRSSLLNLGLVALIDTREQRSPVRQVLAVRSSFSLSGDDGGHVWRWIPSAGFLCPSR